MPSNKQPTVCQRRVGVNGKGEADMCEDSTAGHSTLQVHVVGRIQRPVEALLVPNDGALQRHFG